MRGWSSPPSCRACSSTSSFFFVLGLYLQTGRGDSPMAAGLTFVPLAAGNFVSSLSSGALVGRFGRGTLTAGAALQVARPPRAPRGRQPRAADGPGAGRGVAVRPRPGTADPADNRRGARPCPARGLGGGDGRARHRPAAVRDYRPGPGEPWLLRRRERRLRFRLPGGVRLRRGARARHHGPIAAARRPGRLQRGTPARRGRRAAARARGQVLTGLQQFVLGHPVGQALG